MSDRSMFGPDWTVSPTGNGNEHHLFDSRGKVAATGYKGEKLQYIADRINRIAELEAIVARLPHTADGVPVVPGMEVWWEHGPDDGLPIDRVVIGDYQAIYFECDELWSSDTQPDFYSTPQAAEEASKA